MYKKISGDNRHHFREGGKMNDFICHCFEYEESDIVDDFKQNGYSTIMIEIMEAKKLGGCQCADKNPKGR
jgi:hypothetical protein